MLPEIVIIDVGDLLMRLCSIIAHKQNLPQVIYDTPEEPLNVKVDEYIEMVVDSLVSRNGALESLHYLITLALNEEHVRMDERIGDVLEAMGALIHAQLAQLRLYENNDGPLAYFYTNRGADWIMLTRLSQKMIYNIHERVSESALPKALQSTNTPFRW